MLWFVFFFSSTNPPSLVSSLYKNIRTFLQSFLHPWTFWTWENWKVLNERSVMWKRDFLWLPRGVEWGVELGSFIWARSPPSRLSCGTNYIEYTHLETHTHTHLTVQTLALQVPQSKSTSAKDRTYKLFFLEHIYQKTASYWTQKWKYKYGQFLYI